MKRNLSIFAIILAVGAIAYYLLGDQLSLQALKNSQAELAAAIEQDYFAVAAAFFLVYVGVTALSIPGASVLTLAAGAMFGLVGGSIIVSFASTAGATVAFLISRYLFSNVVEARFGSKIKSFKDGMKKDGAFFLFALRLVPVVPFFVINLLMGLMPISVGKFWWVSQIGMLAGTLVYVNAGTQLSEIENMSDIVSPDILLSFVLLGFFPIAAKKLLEYARKDKKPTS